MTSENSEPDFSRAMVVVAHPDDAEFGCSGTVAKWCRMGWEVVYVMCTDGSKGTDDRNITSTKLSELRKKEQKDAGKILGLKDVAFLGYPDGYLEPTLDLRRDIAREIRRYKPDVLVCMNPNRELSNKGYIGHPDHHASAEAALSAVYPTARDHLTFPELIDEGFEPHKVREVWMMMRGDRADRINELTEEDMDTAVKALRAHTSQVSDPDRAGEWMKTWRGEAGEKIGAKYAEQFQVFKLG
ncbi:MAG: PIG-L family deacetylase [Dehalococcoidia bacterium]